MQASLQRRYLIDINHVLRITSHQYSLELKIGFFLATSPDA